MIGSNLHWEKVKEAEILLDRKERIERLKARIQTAPTVFEKIIISFCLTAILASG